MLVAGWCSIPARSRSLRSRRSCPSAPISPAAIYASISDHQICQSPVVCVQRLARRLLAPPPRPSPPLRPTIVVTHPPCPARAHMFRNRCVGCALPSASRPPGSQPQPWRCREDARDRWPGLCSEANAAMIGSRRRSRRMSYSNASDRRFLVCALPPPARSSRIPMLLRGGYLHSSIQGRSIVRRRVSAVTSSERVWSRQSTADGSAGSATSMKTSTPHHELPRSLSVLPPRSSTPTPRPSRPS